jgi:hypothetical protein
MNCQDHLYYGAGFDAILYGNLLLPAQSAVSRVRLNLDETITKE